MQFYSIAESHDRDSAPRHFSQFSAMALETSQSQLLPQVSGF
jgi:hypothetical protein